MHMKILYLSKLFFKISNATSLYLFIFCDINVTSLSRSDYKTGFGGEFGVQSDRVDKSALGKLESSQTGLTSLH